jgi:acetyltransferase-like isoleucine patch superfamily enzyme
MNLYMLNQTLRNSVVKTLASMTRLIVPVMSLVSKALYNILGYAVLESVGPSVHFFGPVTRLGHGTVCLGKQGHVGSGALFETRENGTIRIGDRFTINRGVVIVARASVDIGNNCLIGEYTSIRDNDHRFDGTGPTIEQGFTTSPIHIEDNVWIGRGCCVLKGVRIGEGAVVAANSVVNKSVPARAVVAGVPAQVVKQRSS